MSWRPASVTSRGALRGLVALGLAWVCACWPVVSAAAQSRSTGGMVSSGGTEVFELGDTAHQGLTGALDFLEDGTASLDIEAVSQPALASRFLPVMARPSGANFGFTGAAIWLRMTLQAPPYGDPHWLLEAAYPMVDRLELWQRDGSQWRLQVAGDQLPYDTRVQPHRNHVLPLYLAPGQPVTLYLRIVSEGTVSAPLRLWRPAALWQADQLSYAAYGLYFGLLVGLLLYNLLLFVSVRESDFLSYALFIGTMVVAQAAVTGVGNQFLWPDWTRWNALAPPVAMSVAGMLGLQFTRRFLHSAQHTPRLDRLLLLCIAGWAANGLLAALGSYQLASQLLSALALAGLPMLMAAGVYSARQGQAGARMFLVAWGTLLTGACCLTLHNLGWLPTNVLTSNALLIGSALQMVLLSFALGDRINVARRFKEQARTRLVAQRSMVEALQRSQEQTQQALSERDVVLRHSQVGIAFLTPTGRIRWANRAMRHIFSATLPPGASTEHLYLSRAHYLRISAEMAASAERGETYERLLKMRRADGSVVEVRASVRAASRTGVEQGTVWVIMDLSREVLVDPGDQDQVGVDAAEAAEPVAGNAAVAAVADVAAVAATA